MLINIGLLLLLGATATAMVISVDRVTTAEERKCSKSFKTGKLHYKGDN